MTLLGSDHVVQESQMMVKVIESVRSWLKGENRACLLIGATGAGKSHLLKLAQLETVDTIVMPPPDGTDCSGFLDDLKSPLGRRVIADDFDKFSKKIREDVINLAAASGHTLLASVTELSNRIRALLSEKFKDTLFVSLHDAASRPEDIQEFVAHWTLMNGIKGDRDAISECVSFCCASRLPQGFRTVETFLAGLAESQWDFLGPLPAAAAASAYRQATSPPPSKPTILVEGYTDRVYLEWLLRGINPAPTVEVRDCGGASVVAEQAIALRNQGRLCVAVLDSDIIGKRLRKQLTEFRHPVVSVPVEALNLPKSAFDHVLEVAEIEDLLPISAIEQFLCSNGRQPELEIRAPTGVRYVIGESDKNTLASWVVEEVDREAVPRLYSLLSDALRKLGITL